MSSTYGTLLRLSTFGESHGPALGAVVDGIPSGMPLDEDDIQRELDRRRPGQSKVGTARNESDTVEILSGVFEGKTTGTPIGLLIRNQDMRSKDYGNVAELYRPGHADYTFDRKFGFRDYRGGGRSSGRETAARVAGGAIARKFLASQGVDVFAYTTAIGKIKSTHFDRKQIECNALRTADAQVVEAMLQEVADAALTGDSVGGVVECRITGLPVGVGEGVFDKLDAELAKAVMSVGAVKGVEFGEGFAAASMCGSEHNDPMSAGGFLSNHAGGILGGMSTGEPVILRAAVKPTPSILPEQKTINRSGEEVTCVVRGRHDHCICPRIVPVIEAMAALAVADLYLQYRARKMI